MEQCKKCKWYKHKCTRLVVPGICGRNDRLAINFAPENDCQYFNERPADATKNEETSNFNENWNS